MAAQNPIGNLSQQDLQNMYPELYQKVKPYIDDIADQLRGQNIDEDMLESIVEDILRNSGLSASPTVPGPRTAPPPSGTCPPGSTSCPADVIFDYYDDYDDYVDYDDSEIISVQRRMPYGGFSRGRFPRRSPRRYPRRYPRRSPGFPIYPVYPTYPIYNTFPADIVKLILLNQLWGY